MSEPLDIAIIGMSGVYAGARDVRAYWQNILDKRYCVTEAPEAWSRGVLDAQGTAGNRVYTAQGGWLHDLAEFDPREFGVMPNTVDGREPDHFLALKQSRDALKDSGYLDKPFNHERAGIILGRGNNTNRGAANLIAHGNEIDQMVDIVAKVRPDFSATELDALREGLRAQLPPFNPEMLPGLIPNVTTGVIANRLDLMGPNCIVDAACASSLVALEQACRELQLGRCDLMLSGGVHAQTPPHSYMIFSQINALSRERIRPFDAAGTGTLLGEGCGIVVLKRLDDAERDGDRIYAVIKGIGVGSDGKAKGLFAPRMEGQVVALRRAYEGSGIHPDSIGLIEAHATGIPLGDRTEIQSLTQVFGPRRGLPGVALGSVKSQISHAIPASGAASLIKTSLALHHKVLPPMLCDTPHPALALENTPFYINNQTRPWVHDPRQPRRAGVNAFGFGGINAHVVLEEHRPKGRAVRVPVLHAPSSGELVMIAAVDLPSLRARIAALHARLALKPVPALAAVAAATATEAQGAHRLALVVSDLDDLAKKLAQAQARLAGDAPAPFKTRGGLFYGFGATPGKVCMLFPGEGAQYPNMLADVCVQFPQAREWFDFLEGTTVPGQRASRMPVLFPPPTTLNNVQRAELDARLFEMDIASESVFAASLALFDVLRAVGLRADAMLGHSTGENTALTASRVRRYRDRSELADTVRDLNQLFQTLEADGAITEGVLLTIGGLRPDARARLFAGAGADYLVAMDNCPNQIVVFGQKPALDALRARLVDDSAICAELPFGRAYHTALFKPIAEAYRDYFSRVDFGPGEATLYSACSAAPFPAEADAIRGLVADQWDHPVRFVETVQRLYDDGVRVFIEVGPSGNLTSFVGDTLRDKADALVVASNSRRKSGLGHLHQTLGQLFAAGVPMQPAGLFAHRDVPAIPAPSDAVAPRLNLMMPRLQWPEKMAVPPLPIPAGARATANHATPAAAPSAPVAPAQAAAPPTDSRSVALQSHFALMQSFLDAQARVLGVFSGSASATPAAAPPPSAPAAASAAYPLLGDRIDEHSADRLVLHHTLRLTHDRFLADHTLGSAPSLHNDRLQPIAVVPFTFSMEMLAEGAHRLLGRDTLKLVAIHQSRGSRWLSLDRGDLALRLALERQDSPASAPIVRGRLYGVDPQAPGGGLMVFEALLHFASEHEPAPPALAWTAGDGRPASRNPDARLYRNGMFHGPRLQGVKHLRRWSEKAIEADLEVLATHDYFAGEPAPRFQFDAALLDAAGQLAGYWLSEQFGWGFNCFPFQVDQCRVFSPPPAAGTRVLCRMNIALEGEQRLRCDFDLIDAAGRLLMRVEGWQDRVFNVPQRLYDFRLKPSASFLSEPWLRESVDARTELRRVLAFDNAFLDEGGGIWKRMLAHLVLTDAERDQFYQLPDRGPRREEWLLGRIAAKDALREWAFHQHQLTLASADIELSADARPVAHAPGHPALKLPPVSISHSRGGAVAMVGEPGAACGLDYQRLDHVDPALLAAGGLSPREHALLTRFTGEALTRTTVALWCAKEAAAKSAGLGFAGRPQDWVVSHLGDGDAPATATVTHDAVRHDIELRYPGPAEVVALCRHLQPAPPAAAHP